MDTNQNTKQTTNTGAPVQKTIKFVPEIATMTISTSEIQKTINTNLQQLIPGVYSRARFEKGALYFEISVDPSNKIFKTNPIAKFGLKTEETYDLTEEGRQILKDYLDLNQDIPMFDISNRKRAAIVIQLNVLKTLEHIVQKCPEGYTYQVMGIKAVPKTNLANLQIAQVAIK